jgi:hypothetical protein
MPLYAGAVSSIVRSPIPNDLTIELERMGQLVTGAFNMGEFPLKPTGSETATAIIQMREQAGEKIVERWNKMR